MDLIEDTELAVGAYLSLSPLGPAPAEKRGAEPGLYLVVYGVLQALVMQQDAVVGAAAVIGLNYALPGAVAEVREVCNLTVRGSFGCGRDAERSFGLSRHSLTAKGFTLTCFDEPDTRDVNVRELIDKQRPFVEEAVQLMILRLSPPGPAPSVN